MTDKPTQGPESLPTKKIERNFIRPTKAPTENQFPETTQADIDKQIATDNREKSLAIEKAISIEKPLLETLPKNPSEITQKELVDRFEELALRCFNKENTLDMAKALIRSYEATISDLRFKISDLQDERHKLRLEITELSKEVDDYEKRLDEQPDRIYGEMNN